MSALLVRVQLALLYFLYAKLIEERIYGQNLYDSVSKVTSIMPVSKDRNENCCREAGGKQSEDKKINFGEILNNVIGNQK